MNEAILEAAARSPAMTGARRRALARPPRLDPGRRHPPDRARRPGAGDDGLGGARPTRRCRSAPRGPIACDSVDGDPTGPARPLVLHAPAGRGWNGALPLVARRRRPPGRAPTLDAGTPHRHSDAGRSVSAARPGRRPDRRLAHEHDRRAGHGLTDTVVRTPTRAHAGRRSVSGGARTSRQLGAGGRLGSRRVASRPDPSRRHRPVLRVAQTQPNGG